MGRRSGLSLLLLWFDGPTLGHLLALALISGILILSSPLSPCMTRLRAEIITLAPTEFYSLHFSLNCLFAPLYL